MVFRVSKNSKMLLFLCVHCPVFLIPKREKNTTTYYISTDEFENLTRALQRQKKKKNKCALSKVKIHIKGYTVDGSTKSRPKIRAPVVS